MTNGFNVLFYCSIMIPFAGREGKEIIACSLNDSHVFSIQVFKLMVS